MGAGTGQPTWARRSSMRVRSLERVFNRDESRILTWSEDKTARLWDTATGKPIGPLLQHEDYVCGAVFTGTRAAS